MLDGIDGVLAELLVVRHTGLDRGTKPVVTLAAGDEALEYRREGFLGVRGGEGDVMGSSYPGRVRQLGFRAICIVNDCCSGGGK